MRKYYLYISIACFVVSAWLLMVMLSGCNHFTPCPEYLQVIRDRPYIPDEYVCMHKSKDYVKHLNEHGYKARSVIGKVRGYKVPHAWVEVIHEGKTYWIDPTWGYGCWKKLQWSDREEYCSQN